MKNEIKYYLTNDIGCVLMDIVLTNSLKNAQAEFKAHWSGSGKNKIIWTDKYGEVHRKNVRFN